jgi:molecular chaperone IbpA
LTGEKPISDLPHYDLIQNSDNHYQLIINVAGYQEENLAVTVQNGQLTITGKYENSIDKKEFTKWLHKGIKKNNFSLSFNLDNRITIKQAEIALGLLTIHFEFDIPEDEKPKKIKICKKNEYNYIAQKKNNM